MSTPVTPSPVQPDFPVQEGAQFSVGDLGPFDQLMHYRFSVPALGGRAVPGKVFLKDALQLTGVEVSYNCFPPGVGMPFLHAHQRHEEIYLFTSGQGEFMVDGEVFPVGEGSVVRVAPGGTRAYRKTGQQPLYFIVLQVTVNSLSAGTIDDGIVQGKPVWPPVGAA